MDARLFPYSQQYLKTVGQKFELVGFFASGTAKSPTITLLEPLVKRKGCI